MNYYASNTSIVRKIWGTADTILLIFAGAAAEFALNKSVDWLYFTGKLPADPIGRLFSTVTYAREIIFSSTDDAHAAVDRITSIHAAIERDRGFSIPDSAYRDVLFMLIHYSIASFEVLERKLSEEEKEEVVQVFLKVGKRMAIRDLPTDYSSWNSMYIHHTRHHLQKSSFTRHLFRQYRKHLGAVRYAILLQSQRLIVTPHVKKQLGIGKPTLMRPLILMYKASRYIGADRLLKAMLLPSQYKHRINLLDVHRS